MQDLLEILENSQAADEFLENTKLELYQDQVFCFTPKGQLIQLPRGATPIDFAYAVHSQVGDTCVGAKVNGRLMPLRHELQNGDQVEIMTARGGTPSPAWERFVVTGKARARIRRYVAQQQRQNHIDAGRAALAKAFRQEGVDGSEKVLEAALKSAQGGHARRPLRRRRQRQYRPEGRRPRRLSRSCGRRRARRACRRRCRRGPAASPARDDGMPITGLVTGMAVHYAGCCHPLPGDRIVGIVTTGKGVTIHTSDCQTLESFAATPERFIDVDWDPAAVTRGKPATHTGRISVIAANEPERARQPDQRDRQARRRDHQPQDHQPPAGFLRGPGRCRGARPRAISSTVIAGLRGGQRHHPGRAGARADRSSGFGSDLCDIRRIERVMERHRRALPRSACSPRPSARGRSGGRERCSAGTFAKRFAAKEACAKALGTGFRQACSISDMGVVNLPSGQPTLRADRRRARRGCARSRRRACGAQVALTMTDEYPYAFAQVIISAVPLP